MGNHLPAKSTNPNHQSGRSTSGWQITSLQYGCGSKPCTPGEHQNRYMAVHPPQNGIGIGYDPMAIWDLPHPALELGPTKLPASSGSKRWASSPASLPRARNPRTELRAPNWPQCRRTLPRSSNYSAPKKEPPLGQGFRSPEARRSHSRKRSPHPRSGSRVEGSCAPALRAVRPRSTNSACVDRSRRGQGCNPSWVS